MGFSELLARWNTMAGADRTTLTLLVLLTVVAMASSIVVGILSRLAGRKERQTMLDRGRSEYYR
jgi:Na+-transporting NADH:ubiquinone oxidoreductase subunit NqrC